MNKFASTDISKVRNYWNSRPCNIRHSTKDVGTREYFDDVERRKYFVEPHILNFADFKAWSGKKVLEIGCGIGTDTMNFARAGAIVTAVDYSEESLKLAKQRAQVFGLNITFYHANAEELSKTVPVEKYDLIYSFGVIHHTPHPEKVIDEIRRYMGPQSVLKIMMYYRWSYKVLWILAIYGKFAFWKLDSLVAKYSEAQTGCPVTYSYSKKTIARLLNGFSIRQIEIDHIFPYRIQDYREYRYVKVWYFRWMPAQLFRWFERHFGWHLCVTAQILNP
jgi:2-polyprenyl-3-methyl-5-hydroxy-6-metoxy-1,4-benzoquinol methylase